MKVAEIIRRRTVEWRKMEGNLSELKEKRLSAQQPELITEFGRRYRSVCGDLSQAGARNFPAATVRYLHQLVADAHTQLYRSENFRLRQWGRTLFVDVPRRIVLDPCTYIAGFLFAGLFVLCLLAARYHPEFATAIVGEGMLNEVESMYSQPLEARDAQRNFMVGFYVFHNAGIGLRCFATGLFLGIGSLFTLAFNAMFLGVIFGHMLESPQADNFVTFVTAHSTFELTAVVLSAAAGLRLGWSLIQTEGWSRRESFQRSAPRAFEIAGTAAVLFLFAAFIEAYVSPSKLPYSAKVGVAVGSGVILLSYLIVGLRQGRRMKRDAG